MQSFQQPALQNSHTIANLIASIAQTGHVSDDDVLVLRRSIFPDGVVDREEIEALFLLGEKVRTADPSWQGFFAEACADFFLNEETPHGYVTDEEFNHLAMLVTRDGKHASALELQALVHLIERARQVPARMTRFVCDQIRHLISDRASPSITAADVDLIRKVLYASGGTAASGISRCEADFLFDLHEATNKSDNADAWRELFVKGIAAHLMQHVGYTPVAREEALRQHQWASDTSVQPGRFMRSMVSGGLSAIAQALRANDGWSERNAQDASGTASAKIITADEADWLGRRIGQNGVIDEAEQALIAYIQNELGAQIPRRLLQQLDAFAANKAA